jgi:cytochrome P450/pimeloyl-ACP methyl ester carboxylesterase
VSATIASTAEPPVEEFRLPDGPNSPRFLNGLLVLFAQRRWTRWLRRRYGDACTLDLPVIGRTVVVSHPDLVKTVYTASPTVLHGGENPLGSLLGPGSLFSMDEERHLGERRMLLPPFHGDRMRSYDGLIEEETLRAMRAWPDGTAFPTIGTFKRITLRVILRAVFGAEGAELADLEEVLPRVTAIGQRLVTVPVLRRDFGRASPGRRFASMRRRYDEIVGGLIDERLTDPDLEQRIDILALMLTTLRQSGDAINRGDVADELLTLLVAGHETTASSLAWTVERLRRHPDVLRRLEREAEGEDAALRTATILEVHRARPVIGTTGRIAVQPFRLGDWHLPPGTRIVTQASVVHADDRFHPNAASFDPDRYIGRKPDTYSWIPFGGGVRRCLGAAFALFEMDVVLRTLLRHFELLPTDAPSERESFRGVAFAPKDGGVAVVRRRGAALGNRPPQTGDAALCPADHAAARCPVDHASPAFSTEPSVRPGPRTEDDELEQVVAVGDGVELCCRVEGDPADPVILLIAGLGQQLNVWPTGFVEGLVAEGYRVVRFDNRDVGRSTRSAAPAPQPWRLFARRYSAAQYTLGDLASDTAGLLDALEIPAAHVVGMSMGGMIGQTLGARWPERVLSLTSLMSSTGARRIGRPALSTYSRMLGRPPGSRELAADRLVAIMRHIGSRGFPFDEELTRAVALEAWDRGGGANPAGLARQMAAIIKSGDRTAELRRITAPTLVVHGDYDRMVHPSGGRATAAAIQGARLETIAGMGHDLPAQACPHVVAAIAAHAGRVPLAEKEVVG